MTKKTDSIIGATPPRRNWASTQWTMVARLQDALQAERDAAWAHLSETYREPMVGYARSVLRRITGRDDVTQDAEEVVQGFLTESYEKDWFARADKSRGKFRAFAKTLLYRATINFLRRRGRIKDLGGPRNPVFEAREDDRIDDLTPEEQAELDEFDRSWFKTTFDRALQTLEEKNKRYFTVIRDLLDNDGEPSPDLGKRVKAERPQQFSLVLHKSRKRFRNILGNELSRTTHDQKGLDEEYEALIRWLLR